MRDDNDWYELPNPKTKKPQKISLFNEMRGSNDINQSEMYEYLITSLLVILSMLLVIVIDDWYKNTQSVCYPYQGPKVLQTDNKENTVLWGTYRPGAYLGLRTKEPLGKGSVAAGLMWYSQQNLMGTKLVYPAIRHLCENIDGNMLYSYIEHDAVNYGHQVIRDGKKNGFVLQTFFLRPDNDGNSLNVSSNTDWTTRILYETENSNSSVSLIWYAFINPGEDKQPLKKREYFLEVLEDDLKSGTQIRIMGYTPSLGDFKMTIMPIKSSGNFNDRSINTTINTSSSSSWCPDLAKLKSCLRDTMERREKVDGISSQIILENKNSNSHPPNFIAVQLTIHHKNKKSEKLSYYVDVAYTQKNKQLKSSTFKNTSPSLIDQKFNTIFSEYSSQFNQKFNRLFPLKIKKNTKGYASLLRFAKMTFSNVAGSLGYFYGSSLVQDDDIFELKNDVTPESSVVKYWSAGLLTAVPSRSKFPTGILWGDGFHGLMLGSWSIKLQLNILGYWMDLLNNRGWIPREQILDSEARLKVPEKFVTQNSREATPPSLLLSIDLLLRQIKHRQQVRDNITAAHQNEQLNFDEIDNILRRLYPRLKAWYTWFNDTQYAVHSYTKHSTDFNEFHMNKKFIGYRWRGRDATTDRELNPLTLTSGMYDYPRSSHPVNDDGSTNMHIDNILNKEPIDFEISERHVDLYCWMAHGARIMSNLHNYLQISGIDNFNNEYSKHFWMLVKNLDRLHWTEKNNDQSQNSNNLPVENFTFKMPMYADYGIHTDDVQLLKKKNEKYAKRIVGLKHAPIWRFVDSHIGYNALYPMFFRLVKDSQRLNAILDLIEGINKGLNINSSLLTKGCGIRSLSNSSSLYKVNNTFDDPPNWRGTVWINMQYLACSSLYYYANLPEYTEFNKYSNNMENDDLEPIQYLDMKTKQRCKRLYDKIRYDVIKCLQKEWDRTGSIWEHYDDEPILDSTYGFIHEGKGSSPFTGWSANVVLLMSEIY